MSVQIEETGPVERKLRIEIPTAEVDAAFDQVYRGMKQAARIPGFRKGKVPHSVVQRYFGERARGEVLERVVQESLGKALDGSGLDVIGEPRIDPQSLPSEGEPYAYEALVDIRPTIELQKVRGLEVPEPELPEPEQDPIEAHLEHLRLQQAQVLEEVEGVAAARGHLAVIDYDAGVEGQPFEGGAGKETVVELGEGRAIPGLEDELLGLTVGQTRDFDLQLPESYPAEAAAGKTARFSVKLVGLKRRELPDLDDDFAKDVSDFADLEELRASLRERLGQSRGQERERRLREAVIDAALAANPFPVPETLVERQLHSRISRAAQQLQQLPEEQLRELVGSWREEWRPAAERDVRMALLVPAIQQAEGIEVSDEDVDEQISELAKEQDESLAQLKRKYREQGVLESLRHGLVERRVVDFLVAEATVSNR